MKRGFFCASVFLVFSFMTCLCAEDDSAQVSQGQFATQLVKLLNLESSLPAAPLMNDYVSALESIGITPLSGWKPREILTDEDYIVIISKISGQEREVYKTGVQFCDKMVSIINDTWKDQCSRDGQCEPMEQLLKDDRYFHAAQPRCPFGDSYHSIKGKNQVKHHRHVQAKLTSSLRWGI